jgi:hypothetical protein
MTTLATTYDVFVSHGLPDRELAADIANRLTAEGMQAFYDARVPVGEEISKAIWDALAECHAFIVIISPESALDAMGMVELGAATAWNKPIYVVLNGPASLALPNTLKGYQVYPRNRIDEVLTQIRQNLEPISEKERGVLSEVYLAVGETADQLGQSPRLLKQLVKRFNETAKKQLSGTQLLSELLRMRKQSKLPKLDKRHRMTKR